MAAVGGIIFLLACVFLYYRSSSSGDQNQKSIHENKDSFNFGDVYAPDEAVWNGESQLKVDGVTPSNVKPSNPLSRESVFIFTKAMAAMSSRNLPNSRSSNTVRPSINPAFGANKVTVKTNTLRAKKDHVDEYKSDFIDLASPVLSPPSSSIKQYFETQTAPSLSSTESTSKPLGSLDTNDLTRWLTSLNYGKYATSFVENGIVGAVLCEVDTTADLNDCGVTMPAPIARAFLKELAKAKVDGVVFDNALP